MSKLTDKQKTLLALLAEGLRDREIAARTGHTLSTVRIYLHELYQAIAVDNRTAAAMWWLKHLNRARKKGENV